MLDHPKFITHRHRLADTLREKGIQNEAVLGAIASIPRHAFVSSALESRAYEDSALPIGKEQTISQPFTVARQTELLEVSKGSKVLEIGTGSGYQAAVLCHIGVQVYSVERHEALYFSAKDLLRQLGCRARLKHGDGTKGWSAFAPYDGIVVTAGAPVIPDDLVAQLSIGGRLVIPIGDQQSQTMVRLTKTAEGQFSREEYSGFSFVPLIGEQGWDG